MKIINSFFLLLCLLCLSIQARATHIVGGEFELLHIEDERYKLNLILYSDVKNMDPRNPIDPYAEVHIWSKANNRRMESVILYMNAQHIIPYTNPDCTIPQLETSKTVYSAVITLSPAEYNDPAGYYINYERCCRNGVISNILDPGATGEAFYMEFPAVVKDGKPFINSSPNLFPPLSDFARLGYPFYFDFSGTDADGDELRYSLTTPLAGSSSPDQGNVLPPPRSAPYNPTLWAGGYNINNIIPGNPSVQITQGGIIKITPTQTGLFVFAVLAEEFRNGKKIGEVRREFQMLVYDYQGDDSPPVLSARKPKNPQVEFKDQITLREDDFDDYETNRCITLEVTDKDVLAAGAANNGLEPLSFRISPVNFSMENPEEMLSVTAGSVDRLKSTLSLDLCLPLCPLNNKDHYVFDVVAYDDACAVPLTDTLRVTVYPSAGYLNKAPVTRTSITNTPAGTLNLGRETGNEINFTVSGTDPDNDKVSVRAEGVGFSLQDYGMEFTPMAGTGTVNSSFSWLPDCNNVDISGKNSFLVYFIAEDEDFCGFPAADTLAVNIKLTPPPNAAPVLTVTQSGTETGFVEAFVDSSLIFHLLGSDPDIQDALNLKLDSISSDMEGILPVYNWQDLEGSGEIRTTLEIDPDCNLFPNGATERSFTFYFSLRDDPCFTSKTDTVSLKVVFRNRDLNFNEVKFINAFTPNADGKNDYFTIENLPEDGCYNKLENIIVYNRWGKILFNTNNRNFRWDGEDFPTGNYFYQVKYTRESFRNSLILIRGKNGLSTVQSP